MNDQDSFDYFSHGSSDFQDILITRRLTDDFLRNQGLKKVWTAKYLWALGTGTALTGFYAQWQTPTGVIHPYSFLAVWAVSSLLYLVHMILVAELAVLFPYAGGPYAFARRGLGNFGGYVAGTAAVFQFVFGAAAFIQLFKSLMGLLVPDYLGGLIISLIFLLLMMLYVINTGISARIQFVLVGCGLSGLILFFIGSAGAAGETLFPAYHDLPFGQGFAAAVPLVLWYYFGLEGLSLVGEETKNTERTLPMALMISVGTVVLFGLGLWFFAVRPMPGLFFQSQGPPLLFILQKIQSQDRVLLSTFSAISLCAYLAGLNGLINGFSRQVYSLARAGYYPFFLSRLHSMHRTPYPAILFPGFAVLAGAFLIEFNFLVYFSLVSALLGQLLVLVSYYRIHKVEPVLFRFRGLVNHPLLLYSLFFLILALFMLVIFTCGRVIWSIVLLWFFVGLYYFFWAKYHIRDEAPEESMAVSGEKKIKIDLR